jgi:eukaryotic-like serine/threonine-protein kinase
MCTTLGIAIERRRPPSSAPPPPDRPASVEPASPAPPRAVTPTPSTPPGQSGWDRRKLVGTVVDGTYLIKGVLGHGGMSIVYDAEQIAIGRPVAIKVLPLDRAESQEAIKRFLHEARAAASLSHPNICQIFNFGTLDDGSPYFTMERLLGEPLSARIEREGALPFLEIIDILMQVLAGLGMAHKKGIVHRDIKPENVFLTPRTGRPPLAKLVDFGLSKAIATDTEKSGDDTTQLTRAGMVMGTPFYMAPEQALGDRKLDERVDLWAVGVLLYEATSGKRPFTATSYTALISQIVTAKPRPLRELRPGTPGEFDVVVERALSKARESRYQTAVEFLKDLTALRMRVLSLGLVPASFVRREPPAEPKE